jgi:hypothetical protein
MLRNLGYIHILFFVCFFLFTLSLCVNTTIILDFFDWIIVFNIMFLLLSSSLSFYQLIIVPVLHYSIELFLTICSVERNIHDDLL